jgi:hypothetical protein
MRRLAAAVAAVPGLGQVWIGSGGLCADVPLEVLIFRWVTSHLFIIVVLVRHRCRHVDVPGFHFGPLGLAADDIRESLRSRDVGSELAHGVFITHVGFQDFEEITLTLTGLDVVLGLSCGRWGEADLWLLLAVVLGVKTWRRRVLPRGLRCWPGSLRRRQRSCDWKAWRVLVADLGAVGWSRGASWQDIRH